MSKITSVVFDLGNVLIDWNPRYLYRKIFKTETEVEWFLENVCDDAWNTKHDAGQPFSKGISELSSLHPQYSEEIRNWFDRCEEMLGGPLDETVEVLIWSSKIQFSLMTNLPMLKLLRTQVFTEFISKMLPCSGTI
jgi:2-haloacid dehalogenase